eukprot:2223530-Rhodomonas_salina.1
MRRARFCTEEVARKLVGKLSVGDRKAVEKEQEKKAHGSDAFANGQASCAVLFGRREWGAGL